MTRKTLTLAFLMMTLSAASLCAPAAIATGAISECAASACAYAAQTNAGPVCELHSSQDAMHATVAYMWVTTPDGTARLVRVQNWCIDFANFFGPGGDFHERAIVADYQTIHPDGTGGFNTGVWWQDNTSDHYYGGPYDNCDTRVFFDGSGTPLDGPPRSVGCPAGGPPYDVPELP